MGAADVSVVCRREVTALDRIGAQPTAHPHARGARPAETPVEDRGPLVHAPPSGRGRDVHRDSRKSNVHRESDLEPARMAQRPRDEAEACAPTSRHRMDHHGGQGGADREHRPLASRAGEATERTTLHRSADAGTRAEVLAVRPLTLRHLSPKVRRHRLLPLRLPGASRPGLPQRRGRGAHAGRGEDPLGHPARTVQFRRNRTLRQRNDTPPTGTATITAP